MRKQKTEKSKIVPRENEKRNLISERGTIPNRIEREGVHRCGNRTVGVSDQSVTQGQSAERHHRGESADVNQYQSRGAPGHELGVRGPGKPGRGTLPMLIRLQSVENPWH